FRGCGGEWEAGARAESHRHCARAAEAGVAAAGLGADARDGAQADEAAESGEWCAGGGGRGDGECGGQRESHRGRREGQEGWRGSHHAGRPAAFDASPARHAGARAAGLCAHAGRRRYYAGGSADATGPADAGAEWGVAAGRAPGDADRAAGVGVVDYELV
ncbi:hypothetical protein LTR53_014167, partial [Teratosphaeriaceae sp. CCFEE 6253]